MLLSSTPVMGKLLLPGGSDSNLFVSAGSESAPNHRILAQISSQFYQTLLSDRLASMCERNRPHGGQDGPSNHLSPPLDSF